MILSIGEILVDMIGETKSSKTIFSRFPGGAPFNLACNLSHIGADVSFCGRVGEDLIGSFLKKFAFGCGFNTLALQTDPERNTTLTFVELDAHGERSFCFYRKGTADYYIDASKLDGLIAEADIVHLGSLMLSEPEGRAVADKIIDMLHQNNKLLSFDINYREDIFESTDEAVKIYKHYADKADIVKYSEEEATIFTQSASVYDAVAALKKSNALSFVTLGKQGSMCIYRGEVYRADTIEIECVDSTGAGDAFFAGALSVLDSVDNYTKDILEYALKVGNICGAITATDYGAIHCGLSKEVISKHV